MIVKCFEIRDDATFIPVIAVKTEPADEQERYLLARCGFGTSPEAQASYVLVGRMGGDGELHYDPHSWRYGRTMEVAHRHIIANFDDLANGAVVDVEFLLGKREAPKLPERLTIEADYKAARERAGHI